MKERVPNVSDVEMVIKLSKKTKPELRKLNKEDGRAYTGKGLTKNKLIYQIVFKRDA